MTDLQRVKMSLLRIMREDQIDEWLSTPNEGFGGLTPLHMIDRGETEQLYRMIHLIESGQPS